MYINPCRNQKVVVRVCMLFHPPLQATHKCDASKHADASIGHGGISDYYCVLEVNLLWHVTCPHVMM
jgi:hypothetical protein